MDDEKIVMVVHEEDENQRHGQQNKKQDKNKEVKQGKEGKEVLKQEERTCTAMMPQLGVSGSGVPN